MLESGLKELIEVFDFVTRALQVATTMHNAQRHAIGVRVYAIFE